MARRALGLLLPFAVGLLTACTPPPPVEPAPPPPPRRAPLPDPFPTIGLVPIETCGDTADGFEDWIASFGHHAQTAGISKDVVERAFAGVRYDHEVIALDRSQRHLAVPFEDFAASHITPGRVKRGRQRIAKHHDLLARISTRFGVPKEIVVAIWGLETDFGENVGSTRSMRALATLAWDCRRKERFRGELMSALRLVQRGDIAIESMVGAWAGELGQTQFLPSSYERFAIDFDGDGRADLVRSTDDALASTAHYLKEHGWRAGERYEEGTPNFEVLAEWNKSETYRRTIVMFALVLAR